MLASSASLRQRVSSTLQTAQISLPGGVFVFVRHLKPIGGRRDSPADDDDVRLSVADHFVRGQIPLAKFVAAGLQFHPCKISTHYRYGLSNIDQRIPAAALRASLLATLVDLCISRKNIPYSCCSLPQIVLNVCEC